MVVIITLIRTFNTVTVQEVTRISLKFIITEKLTAINNFDWFEWLVLSTSRVFLSFFTNIISMYNPTKNSMFTI